MYDYQGTVDILTSIFNLSMAIGLKGSGGALYFFENIIAKVIEITVSAKMMLHMEECREA